MENDGIPEIKRGVVQITQQMLANILFRGTNLENAQITGIKYNPVHDTWSIFVVHENCRKCPEGGIPARIDVVMSRDAKFQDLLPPWPEEKELKDIPMSNWSGGAPGNLILVSDDTDAQQENSE